MEEIQERYYISDDIFFDFNKKQVFKETENKSIEITLKNFKEYFGEYGWDELDFLWNIELGEKFMVLDCGSHGDCLFHCIAEALNLDKISRKNLDLSTLYDIETLRQVASRKLTKNNFELILQNYKIEKEVGEFQGDWDPDEIKTLQQLKSELCKIGNNFWGDHIIIQLLSQALKKNVIVLNGDEDFEKLSYNTVETSGSKGYIIIYFENNCHYKLVGKFNGKKIVTVFNKIPEILLNLEN